jgi:voltage-dependent calcium channel
LLVQVAFFVGFFWIIFAIIGIQSFRGSFRRHCVWEGSPAIVVITLDPLGIQAPFVQEFQFCGGYLDPNNFTAMPYITADGTMSIEAPKGFLCPVQSRCIVCRHVRRG